MKFRDEVGAEVSTEYYKDDQNAKGEEITRHLDHLVVSANICALCLSKNNFLTLSVWKKC